MDHHKKNPFHWILHTRFSDLLDYTVVICAMLKNMFFCLKSALMRFCKHTNGIGQHTQLKYLSLYSIITPNIMNLKILWKMEHFALLEQMLHFS